jgi:hypothetical protein
MLKPKRRRFGFSYISPSFSVSSNPNPKNQRFKIPHGRTLSTSAARRLPSQVASPIPLTLWELQGPIPHKIRFALAQGSSSPAHNRRRAGIQQGLRHFLGFLCFFFFNLLCFRPIFTLTHLSFWFSVKWVSCVMFGFGQMCLLWYRLLLSCVSLITWLNSWTDVVCFFFFFFSYLLRVYLVRSMAVADMVNISN